MKFFKRNKRKISVNQVSIGDNNIQSAGTLIINEKQEYCNKDNVTEAVRGLDIFTKNWCMNCAETDKQKDLIFRCNKCEFRKPNGECLVKIFANSKTHNYDLRNFGSMGSH